MDTYAVEWRDAAGIVDALLTLFCASRAQAEQVALHPPRRWYYWGKRPTIVPVLPATTARGKRAMQPYCDDPKLILWQEEETIAREYGVRVSRQINDLYTVASSVRVCRPRTNLTIYQVGAAIRAMQEADAAWKARGVTPPH